LFFFYLFQVIFCYQFQPHHLISFSFCFKFDPQSSDFYQFVFLSFVGWFFCFQFQTLSFYFIFYFKYGSYFLIVVYFIFILFLIHFFISSLNIRGCNLIWTQWMLLRPNLTRPERVGVFWMITLPNE
jgi:hypothetical protein